MGSIGMVALAAANDIVPPPKLWRMTDDACRDDGAARTCRNFVGRRHVLRLCLSPSGDGRIGAAAGAAQAGVFQKFFPWVWVSVLTLLVTGYWIIFVEWGGFASAGPHVHIMQLTGLLMMALFAHLFFAEWKKFARMVDAEEFSDAATRLGRIRMIVLTNLIIGGVTVLIGASGRYWV